MAVFWLMKKLWELVVINIVLWFILLVLVMQISHLPYQLQDDAIKIVEFILTFALVCMKLECWLMLNILIVYVTTTGICLLIFAYLFLHAKLFPNERLVPRPRAREARRANRYDVPLDEDRDSGIE